MGSIARGAAVTAAIGAVSAGIPAAAIGRQPGPVTSHKVQLAGMIEALSSTGTIGTPGVRDTDAGILDGRIAGSPHYSGALRQVVTWSSGLSLTSRGTVFAVSGSLRFRLTGKFTPKPAGRLALNGRLAVTGGTGLYAGARGTLRVTGLASLKSGTGESTFDLSGSLLYARVGP